MLGKLAQPHELVHVLAQAMYLFSPLIVADALSALVLRWDLLPELRKPVDAGRCLHGKRLFGDSKTWRGFVVGMVGCVLGVAIQKIVVGEQARSIALVDYAQVNVFGLGSAMGFGALLGELPNSFVKRRLGIAPGKTTKGPLAVLFYLWDQLDLLTGAWPLVALWVIPSGPLVLSSLALALTIHPLLSAIGYLIGARKSAR